MSLKVQKKQSRSAYHLFNWFLIENPKSENEKSNLLFVIMNVIQKNHIMHCFPFFCLNAQIKHGVTRKKKKKKKKPIR